MKNFVLLDSCACLHTVQAGNIQQINTEGVVDILEGNILFSLRVAIYIDFPLF